MLNEWVIFIIIIKLSLLSSQKSYSWKHMDAQTSFHLLKLYTVVNIISVPCIIYCPFTTTMIDSVTLGKLLLSIGLILKIKSNQIRTMFTLFVHGWENLHVFLKIEITLLIRKINIETTFSSRDSILIKL